MRFLNARGLAITIAALAIGAGVAEAAHPSDGSKPARPAVVRLATQVSASTLNQVGAGDLAKSKGFMAKLKGSSLKSHGKPELFELTLAWCPHCAAISWAVAIALSRFGTLSGLRAIDSGTLFCTKYHANPCYPHTHGLSFLDARYASRYLSFTDLIFEDVKGHSLEKPTPKENRALKAFDPNGSAPASDVGGRYAANLPYSPGILAHRSWLTIAKRLSDPQTPIAKSVDGLANVLTAAICKTTKQHPRDVCSSKGVGAAAKLLPS